MRAVIAGELTKAVTLPAVLLTAIGTVIASGVLGAALAASGAAADPLGELLERSVPYLQAGFVLLGVLPVAHEYAGSQVRVSLAAVPDRRLLIAGKTVAVLALAGVTAAASVGTTFAAGVVLMRLDGGAPALADAEPAAVTGYYVVISLLSASVALLLRQLVPALVTMLAGVMIVSPVLAAQSEHARWLPDRAARQLYESIDTALTPATGALVALGWIVVLGAAASWRFMMRDA